MLILMLFAASAYPQQLERVYTIEDLKSVHPDSVLAIDLSKNKLERLPEYLREYKNLQYLDLGKNNLNSLQGLEQLTNLKYLNLERNKLELFPVQLCALQKLDTLILNRIMGYANC